MLNKKIHSIILAGIMLISVLAIIPATQAASPHTVKGILYINDEIPTSSSYDFEKITIKLVFTSETYNHTIYEYNLYADKTNYNVGLFGHEGETANIIVKYYGHELVPEDNKTITIDTTTGYIMDLHIDVTGMDAESPSKVTGLAVTDAKDGKLNLAWTAATDNVKVDYYNIYRDGSLLTTTTTTTYQNTGLTNGQNYCYKISAVDTSDNEGEKSDQKCAKPTATTSGGGSGGDGGSSSDTTTDDDTTTTGDDNETEIVPNNPPLLVEFIGDEEGSKNTVLSYSATATDADGHNVQYIFDWDDGTENETAFVANGTKYDITHVFTTAGVYDISVYAIDDYANATSSTEDLQVLIDAHIIDDSDNNVDGYLTDNDSDGTYDNFHNNKDDSDSTVGTENGSYLLDTDGDGEYDYRYDPNTRLGEIIKKDAGKDETAEDNQTAEGDNTLLYVGAILIIIVLLLLFFLATRKKDKGKK